jgi:hypothetical protein
VRRLVKETVVLLDTSSNYYLKTQTSSQKLQNISYSRTKHTPSSSSNLRSLYWPVRSVIERILVHTGLATTKKKIKSRR